MKLWNAIGAVVVAGVVTAGLVVPTAMAGSTADARQATYRPTLKASSSKVVLGQRLILSGKVKPATKGGTVVLQKRLPIGKKWVLEARLKTKKSGAFTYTDKPHQLGVRSYRVVVPKAGKVGAGHSKIVKVTVYGWRSLATIDARTSDSTDKLFNNKIAGTTYSLSYGPVGGAAQGSADWNLDPTCTTLRVRFGNGDDSDEGAIANLVLTGDGQTLFSGSFGLTQSEARTFDISDVFRLKYSWTSTVPGSTDPAPGAQPLLAEPELLCAS